MGAGGSKAAARTYQAAEATAAKAAAQRAAVSASGALARDEAAAAAAQQQPRGARPALTLEEEEALEAKDSSLDQLLSQLGGSIRGTRVDICGPQGSGPRAAAQDVSLEGRLPPDALRELFQLQAHAEGGALEPGQSIAKYKPDADLMRRVLARACMPHIIEAQGAASVAAFADWPGWFRRRAGK